MFNKSYLRAIFFYKDYIENKKVEGGKLKRYFALLLAVLLLFCQVTPEEHVSRAIFLMEKKEYKLAINELNDAISKKPDYAEAYLERGKCRMFNHGYSEAKGDTSYLTKMFVLAAEDFTRAIELKPSLKNKALDYRGGAYYLVKNYKKAIEDFESLLKSDSTNYRNISMLSVLKIFNKDTLGVIKLHDDLIKKYPQNAELYYARATSRLVSLNDKKRGCEDLLVAEKLFNKGTERYNKSLIENIKKLQQINCNK